MSYLALSLNKLHQSGSTLLSAECSLALSVASPGSSPVSSPGSFVAIFGRRLCGVCCAVIVMLTGCLNPEEVVTPETILVQDARHQNDEQDSESDKVNV